MAQGRSIRRFVRGLSMFVAASMVALISSALARAQTYTVLHSFCSAAKCTDGDSPGGPLLQASDGYLYGTTGGEGLNKGGTLFKMSLDGKLTTLYSFCSQPNCADGDGPDGSLIQATNGYLYGTTYLGGSNNQGTVFSLAPGALTTIHSFCGQPVCPDGSGPHGALLQATNGNLFGTNGAGGADDWGTVFTLNLDGTLTTLADFCRPKCTTGYEPNGTLVQAANGNMYGTTQSGGSDVFGTVFQITPNGVLTPVAGFGNPNGPGGSEPSGPLLLASDGNLYGATRLGGVYGLGSIFKMTPGGTVTTIYSFGSNGNLVETMPYGPLIQATDGNFYGTTSFKDSGTIFKLTPAGVLTTLHAFCSQANCADGYDPSGGLFQATNGNLYGIANQGGACSSHRCGTVYRLDVGLGPFVILQTTSGNVGASVKILGTSLTGTSSVTFNGTPAAFTVNSGGTAISATVPPGATTGTVEVATPNGMLKSNVIYTVE